MSSQSTSLSANVLSALGTLIGYIGSEVVTEDVFERLLWPQRFYNVATASNFLPLALFIPMGGPLHKVALTTLDRFFALGIFRGDNIGHMLGTAFFTDSGLTYELHEPEEILQKQVRNGFWVSALAQIPVPSPSTGSNGTPEDGSKPRGQVRQRTAVSHLTLSITNSSPKPTKPLLVDDTGPITLRILGVLVLTEITGIATCAVVAGVWKSYFAFLWVLPLVLKLLSAVFAIPREKFKIPPQQAPADKNGSAVQSTVKRVLIHSPDHGFHVIEGEEDLILQFFRHYGHPIRNRTREIIQILIITAFGCLFPVGLVVSLVCMPTQLQFMWLGYQVYAAIAMHIYRYAYGHHWATTAACLAEELAEAESKHDGLLYLTTRTNKVALELSLCTTFHDRYGEAKAHAMELLGKHKPAKKTVLNRRDTTFTEHFQTTVERIQEERN